MPNIKSAEKRTRVIGKKTLQNKMIRSQMNTAIKKFNAAVSGNDIKTAENLLPQTFSLIDHAAVSGVIHKNNANNKKSRLSKTLHALKSGRIVIRIDAKQQKQLEQKAAGARKKAAEADRITAREAGKAAAGAGGKTAGAGKAAIAAGKVAAAKADAAAKKEDKKAEKEDKKAQKEALKEEKKITSTLKKDKPNKSEKAEAKKENK